MKLGNLLAAPLYAALLVVYVLFTVLAGYVALVHELLRWIAQRVRRASHAGDVEVASARGEVVAAGVHRGAE